MCICFIEFSLLGLPLYIVTMIHNLEWFVLLHFIPIVLTYQHTIVVSQTSSLSECIQLNESVYHCQSIDHAIELLSQCCNSTEIVLKSDIHQLTTSHVVTDLHNIRITSEAMDRGTIQCPPNVDGNHDFDTGLAFVRVSDLIIENVNIFGCGMKHVSTNHVGLGEFILVRSALYIQNSTNISLYNMTISNNNGIGLLMYDTNGTVNITETSFISNKLNVIEQSRLFTGGGGIYVHFSGCSPGLLACDPNRNPYNKFSAYVINHCRFEDNVAVYHLNGSEPEDLASGVFVTFGTGGGLSFWFYGETQNNSFHILSSVFVSNTANYGAGLNVHSRQNTKYNLIEVLHCLFINNTANFGGGGLALGYVIYQTGGKAMFNTYTVANCLFEQNKAIAGVGGALVGFGSREPQRTQPTNTFEVCNSSFIRNEAQYGSAIQINREYFDSIAVGTYFILEIDSCNFTSNSLRGVNARLSNSSSIGAVALSGIGIRFRGNSVFADNNSTALVVDGATAEFSNDSVTMFQDNSGLHGGAILLISGAWFSMHSNSSLVFLRNRAVDYGGAIYVELSTPFDYLLSHVCFVRYFLENVSPAKWNVTFTFINNTAGQSDNVIFASTLQPCLKVYTIGSNIFDLEQFYRYPTSSYNAIATSPAMFKFLSTSGEFYIVPGEVSNLPVYLVDELGQNVTTAIFVASCNESPSPYVLPLYQITNGTIQIAGKPNEVCHLTLQTDTDYQVATTLQVTLLNCPPGFTYNDKEAQCECLVNRTHHSPAIGGCELASFQAYFNQFYWIGYDSDNATDLLTSSCPYQYCYDDHIPQDQLLPQHANKTTLDQFVCGDRSRTGLLCGRCVDGYSVALNSPTFSCHHCRNHYLGILYLFLSYIVPVTGLFCFIMAYNVRMTTGPIGAFLFFSQIISSQYRFAFVYSLKGSSDDSLAATNVVVTLYSITNLEFFNHNVFSYCLFPSAGTVDIISFNLLLSFYPVILIFGYFLLRRYCNCKYRFFRTFRLSTKSVTHGICAFLVLCFAKINVLAFGILKSANLSYINGPMFRRVVFLQGDIEYFKDAKYNVYAAGSLITIVTVLLFPTLILVLHPIMISVSSYFKWGDSKCVEFVNKILLINKLKPVLDSFQGDYKDNLSFFAGLHSFLYRIIFFTIVVAASTPDVDGLLFAMIIFFLVILLIHVLAMPFKRYVDNAAYSVIYLLMLTILIIEHYLFSTNKSSEELIWIEIFMSLLPLGFVMLYYSWKLLLNVLLVWKKYRGSKYQPALVSIHVLYI